MSDTRRQFLAMLTSLLASNCHAEKRSMTELKWEWPADRKAETSMVVRVTSFEAPGKGLFGIRRSPSIAGNLPDPRELRGTVQQQSSQSVLLVLPGPELPANLKAGDLVRLSLLRDHVCIGIEVASQSTTP